MPSPERSPKAGLLLRPGEWALVLAILIAVALTALVDANHSYWFRPLESLRDIARNTALLGIFALGATVVIIAGDTLAAVAGTSVKRRHCAIASMGFPSFSRVSPRFTWPSPKSGFNATA